MIHKYKKDIIIILILIVITIIAFFVISASKTEGNYVVVTIDNKVYETYDIHKDTTVVLPTGNTLTIDDGCVSVTESDCPDKICVNSGKIHAVGETIICLPHKLVVEVQENIDE